MKKYIFLISVLLFPYMSMALLVSGISFDKVLLGISVMFLLGFMTSIINLICAIRNKWNAEHLALENMIIKLVQIPAYVIIFVIGLSGVVFIQFIAVSLILFLFDCITILFSGLVALSAVIRAKAEGKIDRICTVIFIISSFVFCIDVIFAVVLYILIKMKNKAKKIQSASDYDTM